MFICIWIWNSRLEKEILALFTFIKHFFQWNCTSVLDLTPQYLKFLKKLGLNQIKIWLFLFCFLIDKWEGGNLFYSNNIWPSLLPNSYLLFVIPSYKIKHEKKEKCIFLPNCCLFSHETKRKRKIKIKFMNCISTIHRHKSIFQIYEPINP